MVDVKVVDVKVVDVRAAEVKQAKVRVVVALAMAEAADLLPRHEQCAPWEAYPLPKACRHLHS